MFKAVQVRTPHAHLEELSCHCCGVILFVEMPKGERVYTCVCGYILELIEAKAA